MHAEHNVFSSMDCQSMEKAVTCTQESRRTSHWSSTKLNRLISMPPTIYRGKHIMFYIICRCCLQVETEYKVSWTEKWSDKESWTGTLHHSWKSADAVCQTNSSKLVGAVRNYSLPKLAHSCWDTAYVVPCRNW